MRQRGWIHVVVCVLALLVTGAEAHAAGPTDHLRAHVDRTLGLLRDPALATADAAHQRRSVLRQLIDSALDLPAMAERALGRHWEARTAAERAEFVTLFGTLLESIYAGEIERHSGDTVTYLSESVTGHDATVATTVAGKAGTRVDYRMHLRNDRWLVYDVLVGGVSIIDNFRSQLHRLLRDGSYAGMIDKLREATGGQAAPRPR